MTNIFAKTTDQVLSATVLPKVACNNQNTVRLQVEFDAPWDGYTKTAVFYTSKNPLPYERALSSDGICLVPSEVLTEKAHLIITVKGVKTSGEIKSTTPLKMRILEGTPTVIVSEPTDDVYRELLGDYDRTNNAVAVERARIDNLVKNSGSVEGDEVVDARVGFDGTTYPTAGDAVRKQTGLQSAMIHGGVITMTLAEVKIDGARVDSGGSKVVDSGWCHGYIDILSAKEVTIDTSTISDTTIINFANKNKEHVTNYKNWAPPAVYEVDIPDEARYLCISGKNVDADKVIITYSVEGLAVRTEQDIQDLKIKSVSPPPFLVGGESEINLSDVSLTYGIFRPTGDIVESATFLYGFIDISNAETFTVEMVEMTDTATVNFVDADKNFVSSALVWKGTGVYEISYMPDTAKYISVCCQKVDIDCISVKVKHKSVMKDVETNREDSTRHDAAYAHTRTNGAKFIKGLHLDCGRKYFSVANIKTLLDEMHEANLNTFQIYFSDNEGFRFGLDDMNVTVNGVAYDVSVALGDGSSPTDGSGKWLTQEEMDDIISYAEAYGIEVIPAFDMPGHFGAIRSKFNEPKFQETTEHGRTFMCELLKKYASYFASKGCRYFNICGDETSISTELYEKFMSRAIYEICKLNMTPLFYNDSVCKDGYYSPYLNNGGIVLGWIRRAGQAAYSTIDRCGYRMMNAKASPYYWVLNEDEKSADLVERIRNSDIFEMADGSKMYNIVGAMYHIWCDIASLHGADEGDQIIRETAECIAAFGEAVNRAVPTDYWTPNQLRPVQTTGDSEKDVMSQKAVTDFVGEIYGVDKNNLFNAAKLTPDAYYRNGVFLYDSTQYSVFEVEVEKGVTYRFAHQVRFIVVKDGDTVVEELQNARTFTANGTKAFVSVFNTHKTDRWKMCKESLSLSEVSNYGQQGVRGELKDCATSVEHLDNYIIPSFVENENLLFGATYKEGYYNNGAEAVNSSYNLFANIPVKAGVNYIIEPKARFVMNVPSNGASNEKLVSGNHTSITPTHDGLLQLSMYASDDIETYAFYAEGAENVFPVTKTKLSDNVLLSNNDILSGKKWAVFGDSFTHGATSGKIADGKYAGKQKTYPYFIGNRTGMEILNFFAGGRTLACPSDGSFTNSITCPSASCYYQNVPADVDYITIYLGINDSHHENGSSGTDGEDVTGVIPLGSIDDANTSTYYGAWNVVLPWLMENRPYAHIGIIVSNGCDRAEYRTAQIEIAKKYGVPYIDLNGDERTPVMIRSQNPDIASSVKTIVNKKQAVDYDGTTTGSVNLHPNDEAHEYESTFIENFLRSL